MRPHDDRSLCGYCNSYKAGEHQKPCPHYVAPTATVVDQLAVIGSELSQLRQVLEVIAKNSCCASCREAASASLAAKSQVQP